MEKGDACKYHKESLVLNEHLHIFFREITHFEDVDVARKKMRYKKRTDVHNDEGRGQVEVIIDAKLTVVSHLTPAYVKILKNDCIDFLTHYYLSCSTTSCPKLEISHSHLDHFTNKNAMGAMCFLQNTDLLTFNLRRCRHLNLSSWERAVIWIWLVNNLSLLWDNGDAPICSNATRPPQPKLPSKIFKRV
jgi:hypothetical protein